MSWYAVRAVYSHGRDPNGAVVYEERILMFRSGSVEEAFGMAEAEAAQYLKLNPTFRKIGEVAAFVLGEVDDLHGAEVWSTLGTSSLPPEEFFRHRYTEFEFRPPFG
ncbi:MAG: hypothetical protein EHM61_27340 [Acidobacteria bacterium]|nr:MAG: hypothetical protein EHM61_27340 [Acidobacteriota bacterium]